MTTKYGLEFDQDSNIYARHEGTITMIAEAGTVKAVAIRAALREAADRMRERCAEVAKALIVSGTSQSCVINGMAAVIEKDIRALKSEYGEGDA